MIKTEIRKILKEKRANMSPTERAILSRLAAQRFLASDIYKNSQVIMLYSPLGNETDTSLISEQIYIDGKIAVLPVTNIKTGDIIPSITDKSTTMTEGAYKICEPQNIIPVDERKIDAVIVPGIAFDKTGMRVGFGKGYYDRFLKNTKAKKIGYCYTYQLCESIAADPFDIGMDYIITDKELINCE